MGIDISTQAPQAWSDDFVSAASVTITMGCGDGCPVYPGKCYEDWPVSDLKGFDVESVRPIRDDIEGRVRKLLAELGIETDN